MPISHSSTLALVAVLMMTGVGCGRSQPSATATTTPTKSESMSDHVNRYHVLGSLYDPSTKVLHIRLAAGIYRFFGVPKDLAERFARAPDQDASYLAEFKDRFGETYIPPNSSGYGDLGL